MERPSEAEAWKKREAEPGWEKGAAGGRAGGFGLQCSMMKEEEAWMKAQIAGVARRTAELVGLPSPSTP